MIHLPFQYVPFPLKYSKGITELIRWEDSGSEDEGNGNQGRDWPCSQIEARSPLTLIPCLLVLMVLQLGRRQGAAVSSVVCRGIPPLSQRLYSKAHGARRTIVRLSVVYMTMLLLFLHYICISVLPVCHCYLFSLFVGWKLTCIWSFRQLCFNISYHYVTVVNETYSSFCWNTLLV